MNGVFWEISSRRTTAIVSTKNFNFLQNRTRFASIVSSMMSIETIVLKQDDSTSHSNSSIQNRILNTDEKILRKNSQKMESIIDSISLKFKDVSICRKLTYKENLLGGVTLDWRQSDAWNSIRNKVEQHVLRTSNVFDNNCEHPLFVQKYSSHPFIEIYTPFFSCL